MIEVTVDQLYGWIIMYVWPFFRLVALFSVAPLFGERSVPVHFKIGLAAVAAMLIAPVLPPPPTVGPTSYEGLLIIMQQVTIGLALGFVMKIVFMAIQTAGELIGLQMGLSFASFFTQDVGSSNVLSRFLGVTAILLFLAFNVHIMVIEMLVESFKWLPIGSSVMSNGGWWRLTAFGGFLFSASLMLALPIMTALLLINFAMAVLNRVAPQFSIYSVGFAITLLSGMVLMTAMHNGFGPLFTRFFEAGLTTMRDVAMMLAPSRSAGP